MPRLLLIAALMLALLAPVVAAPRAKPAAPARPETRPTSQPATRPAPTSRPASQPAAAATPAKTTQRFQLLVPAYFGNDKRKWERLAEAAYMVPIVAVLNPTHSGPSRDRDRTIEKSIVKLHATGGKVLGYIDTERGRRSFQRVQIDIDRYARTYDIDGLFLDHTTTDAGPEHLSYYKRIRDYANSLRKPWFYIGNPGQSASEAYITQGIFDSMVVYEGGKGYDAYRPAQWNGEQPSFTVAHLIYNTPAEGIKATLTLAADRNAGFICVTDDFGGKPWSRLPIYFDDLVSAVRAYNRGER